MILFIRQAWLVLVLSLGFGVALAGVNEALKGRIAENSRLARQKAAVEVFLPPGMKGQAKKDFLENTKAEEIDIALGDDEIAKVYRVTDADNKMLGWAVPAQGQGYADTIKLVVGLTPDRKKLTGVKVIYNQETPGLGNMIEGLTFRQRFHNKVADGQIKAVKKSTGLGDAEIQAITGATVSSEAVCDIIHARLDEKLLEKLADQSKK